MRNLKIAAVSYSNTWPFIYGLNHFNETNNFEIFLKNPAQCAQAFQNNQVDVALVPVGALNDFEDYKLVTNYCIGAQNKVRTVTLLSQVPLSEIKKIYLDYQSRTSVKLVQLLAEQYWKISPQFIKAETGFEKNITGMEAAVVIGDRVFQLEKNIKYIYDLSEEWYKWKNLPFVFAVWIAKPTANNAHINQLNEALKFGVNHIKEAIAINNPTTTSINKIADYLTNNIKYQFNETMQQAMRIFLNNELVLK